jgi:hypothetical protein
VVADEKLDCNKLKQDFVKCNSLQYDRWLHPSRHEYIPADYEVCQPMFEFWKSCVMDDVKRRKKES